MLSDYFELLGSAPYSEMITVIEDNQLSDYQKCKNVIELLKVRFGGTNAGAVSKVCQVIWALKNPDIFGSKGANCGSWSIN